MRSPMIKHIEMQREIPKIVQLLIVLCAGSLIGFALAEWLCK